MRLILHFLKPYRLKFLLICLLLSVDVVGTLAIPTVAARVLNLGTAHASFSLLVEAGLQMSLVALVTGVATTAAAALCAELCTSLGRDIRCALYAKSMRLSVYDFRHFGVASVTTRTSSDVTTVQTLLTQAILMVVPVPLMAVAALVMTFSVDVTAGWFLVASIAVLMVVVGAILRSVSPLFTRLQKQLDAMTQVLLENLSGVRVVRAFNRQRHENGRLDASFAAYAETAIKANKLFTNVDGFQYVVMNVFVIAVYWTSGARIAVGELGIGDITALVEYAIMVLMYILMAQFVFIMVPRALECASRIQELLDYAPEIDDLPDAVDRPSPEEGVPTLRFSRVRFRYQDAQEDALTGIDLECWPGTTTAIIGGTGSGKSTIASLIMRFNEVTQGSLELDGVDVRHLTQRALRGRIGYVQQKAWLASGTIAENLRWERADATDDELWHALEVAQAADFVRGLPEGLDAPVAQGGSNFSGGQRQRLAIARALVARSELYVFDDSFSALDFKTDAALRAALAGETAEAAVLIIAQRVSTIRHADQILVIDEGRPVGLGTHDELMAACPVYREIVASQTKQEVLS